MKKCPMCTNECDEKLNNNYVYFTYNYFREWTGDRDEGSWVRPSRHLICSDCISKYCDYQGESHLRDHPPLWTFKNRELLHKYWNGLNAVILEEMATEEKERVIKMAKKLVGDVEKYNPYNSLRIQYVDHVGGVVIEYQSCGNYKLPKIDVTPYIANKEALEGK